MRPERSLIIDKVISEFWQQDISNIANLASGLKFINRPGWKFIGLLPSYKEHPPAVIKVYFRGNGFDHEIKGINAANSFAPIGNVTTPKVLKVFPEYNAIITEYVHMRDSRSALRRFCIRNQKINWKDVGAWLRNFHDAVSTNQQNKTFIEHKIQKSHDQIEKFASLFSDDQVNRINSINTAADADLRETSHEWVISHGDFHTGNIQISGKSTYIIDFENTTMTPRGYEVIYFLSCLEATVHFLFSKRMFRWLSREFLKGYGMEFSPNPHNNYYFLMGKLDMIAYYRKRFNSTRNKLLKFMFSYLEKQIAKSLALGLSESRTGFE